MKRSQDPFNPFFTRVPPIHKQREKRFLVLDKVDCQLSTVGLGRTPQVSHNTQQEPNTATSGEASHLVCSQQKPWISLTWSCVLNPATMFSGGGGNPVPFFPADGGKNEHFSPSSASRAPDRQEARELMADFGPKAENAYKTNASAGVDMTICVYNIYNVYIYIYIIYIYIYAQVPPKNYLLGAVSWGGGWPYHFFYIMRALFSGGLKRVPRGTCSWVTLS